MNILITGGAGYIGSHLIKNLLTIGDVNITVIDNLSTGYKESVPESVYLYEVDLTDKSQLLEVFKNKGFDIVFHLAASLIVSESVKNPLAYYENNLISTLNLLQVCNQFSVNKFIFSSTAAVYGENEKGIVTEKSPTSPINPYGYSKLTCEQMIIDNAQTNNSFKYCILRYFNVAGADITGELGQKKDATHLFKVVSQAALGKRSYVEIFGEDYNTEDGTCIRDFIHINDLVQAHIDAKNYLKTSNSGIFNCGYGKGYSVLEVVNKMKEVSGNNFKVVSANKRKGDIPMLIADNSKIKKLMKWKPKYDNLEFICKSAYEWEKGL